MRDDNENIKNNPNINVMAKLAITRPVTVIMSLLALIVVGYIAYTQIAVELMPAGFSPPYLGVYAPYPNANPEEVEQFIARPIEEVVRTIKGIKTVSTRSFTSGCWTFLHFNQGTDMDLAYSQLRDRMERVRPDLPEDLERTYIRKWSNDDDPVIWLSLSYDKAIDDPFFLIEQYIKKPLERIDGVASVEIEGVDEKSVQIRVKQDAVKRYRINLYEVIQKLRNDNFAMSSGNLREGNQKIYVRSVGKFKTLDDIRRIPVKGPNILLKDIVDVEYDVPEKTWVQRLNGRPSIELTVFKESMANTVSLTRAFTEKINKMLKNDPRLAGFKMSILFNQGDFIVESIDNLKNAGIWGGLFAFLVLYFFLRRLRMTIILNVAIPLSIMVSMTVLYFIGWTLNLITMMGLMISIGMVVDNSIVVVENIYRKRKEGLSNKESAAVGASEVGLAVTMATFTTIVVFLPLILMNDDAGFRFYMLRIGVPVIVSLLASLLVAMVFIPLASSRIVSKKEVKEPDIILKANGLYKRFLSWTLVHRIETFLALMALLVSSMMVSDRIAATDNMEGNINNFRLFLDLPDNYTLEDTDKIISIIEDTITAKADIYNIKAIDTGYRVGRGRVSVFLNPEKNQNWYDVIYIGIKKILGVYKKDYMDRTEVIEDVKKRLPDFPGVKIRTTWRQSSGGDDASLTISLYGDDTNKLADLSKEVERRLRSIEGIISVETDREKGEKEIRLRIDRKKALKFGISPQTVSGTIMYALRGIQLPKYQTAEKEVDIIVQLRKEDRETMEQLKNITFFSKNGKEVPLSAIASFTVTKGFGSIHRENGKTYLGVKVNTTKENMSELFSKIDQAMAGFQMPYGYSWSKGQRFRNMNESNKSQTFAIYLSITFVFLLMGILFESFVLPLSVIVAIPFSFVGAYWLLFITDTPMDMMSRIGFIILIGIVVNNAIVLIDLVNRLRHQGRSRFEALVEAGQHRFRPILMTAFTTIGGLIPMAVGNSKMIGIPYAPMGRTIIGGLIFATFVSLIAVPWAYTVFDDMRTYFRKLVGGVIIRRKMKSTSNSREPKIIDQSF